MQLDQGFLEQFQLLSSAVGRRVDPTDEHDRYQVYRTAMRDSPRRPLLLACLRQDPDRVMVSGVVVDLLEVIPAADRRAVLDEVRDSRDSFVRRRADELGLLEQLATGSHGAGRHEPTEEAVERLLAATDWLQRRVAAEATDVVVLEALAERGRTRRIRECGRDRLRQIEEAPLLARLTGGTGEAEATAEKIERLLAGSEGLQRRVATEATALSALQALAERGRTHRIRGSARDRLHRLGRAG
jgi:hypothetical protein